MEMFINVVKWISAVICLFLGLWMIQPFSQLVMGIFFIVVGVMFFKSTLPEYEPIDFNELRIKSLQKQFDTFMLNSWKIKKN
jgi:hypothetical protein